MQEVSEFVSDPTGHSNPISNTGVANQDIDSPQSASDMAQIFRGIAATFQTVADDMERKKLNGSNEEVSDDAIGEKGSEKTGERKFAEGMPEGEVDVLNRFIKLGREKLNGV